MKKGILFLTVLVVVFSSSAVISVAYDATGKWNYEEHSLRDNCGNGKVAESGVVGILQTGGTFLVFDDFFSTYGNVSGNTYEFSDTFCQEGGEVSLKVSITLTSETTASGTGIWTWSDGSDSCSGDYKLTLSKQTQAAAVYDATGKWNFNQSGFSHNCDSATTPRSSGYFDVTQAGNKITAIDDQGEQFSGFVNGDEYAVVQSYLVGGGRNTAWATITLSSATQGSGKFDFVWDDDCYSCGGNWDISITKVISTHTITASAGLGGSISPSGSVSVTVGTDITFTITANSGYEISDVKIDGSSVGAVSNYSFTNVQANHTIEATFSASTVWALISLIKQPVDTSIASVLESISGKYLSVWAYIDGSWRVYDPDNPGFSDLTTMEAGRGYWINMTEYAPLSVTGSTPPKSIDLQSGWNLVGYNSSSSQSVSDALNSINGKYVSVWAYIDGTWKVYDPSNPGFSDLTTMEPGYGYWINATEACTWTLL